MIKKIAILFMLFLASVTSAFASEYSYAYSRFNLSPGVTPISRDIYALHMTIFWICVGIGVVVFGVMFYSLIMHRKARGVTPATFHGHTRTEIFWAIVPLLILIVMAIPATAVLIRMNDDSQPDVNIKVTGYQWYWRYEYLDDGISYFSRLSTPINQIQNQAPKGRWYLLEVDKPLVLPIHKKIRFLVTSNDVIHSWWVPAFGIKRDAIPGFVYESWAIIEKPGIYRGQCAELCGMNHGFMPIVVIALAEEDYKKWLKQQRPTNAPTIIQEAATKTWTLEDLVKHGEEVYTSHCAVCHKSDGSGQPPVFPAMKGDKIATGPIQNHIHIVYYGKSGTAMQSFAPQLDDIDIAAVITYERNSFGNADQKTYGKNAGGLVQPSQIIAERKKQNTSGTSTEKIDNRK